MKTMQLDSAQRLSEGMIQETPTEGVESRPGAEARRCGRCGAAEALASTLLLSLAVAGSSGAGSLTLGCAHSGTAASDSRAAVQKPEGDPHRSGKDPAEGTKMDWNYPATRAENIRETHFGVEVSDPYRWLEDWSAPEVRAWTDAQDNLARAYLGKLPGRDRLEARLKELYYVDSVSPPTHRGSRYFYSRRLATQEKTIFYWREGENGEERVLLDPNKLSPDGSISVGALVPSEEGKYLAFSLKENNADEATLYVMEVATGKRSELDVIPGAKYANPDWTPDSSGFYYTYLPTDPSIPVAERPGYAEVRFHKLGTDPRQDPVIHPRTGNPKTFIGPSLSKDGRWLFVSIQHGWNSRDLYLRDLKSKDSSFQPYLVGKPFLYEVYPWKDSFYILTNEDAPRSRVFKAPAGVADRSRWVEIIPQDPKAVIEDIQVVGNHLVLTRMLNAASELQVRDLDGTLVRAVDIPPLGYTYGMNGNPDEDEAYFTYMSFIAPPETYKTSIKSGQSSLWYSVKVPVDPSPYMAEQVWYPSKDGTQISMFIVRRKDMKFDGSTPVMLTGYGGFNVSQNPYFNSGTFVWLEAGGAVANPNLRGGGEYGEEWHRSGMLDKKQNVFDDFIGAAEFLIQKGYTRPERLSIRGGSNGGLLVGAAMTQRPDLFKAVVCGVPLLDMLRYHLYGSGRTWIPEYGSAENEADFRWLQAYSPYHHVKTGAQYPSMLMLAADSDDRVDPMHARKFTALLQAANGSNEPQLMRVERHAGHGGADLVKQAVAQSVDTFAFLMDELGMTPSQKN